MGIFNEKKCASMKQRLKGGVKMPGDVKSRSTINSHLSSQVKLMPPEPLSVTKKAESAQSEIGKENSTSTRVLEMQKKDEILRESDLTVD